jgi:DNA-binding transcriptional regulator GbsR (MarR family)
MEDLAYSPSALRKLPPKPLEELAESVGAFIEFWGFKNVHGRLWTFLLLADRPLDASDLIQRLQVSKALVSMTLSDLLEHRVIEEAGKSHRGTQLYRPNPDLLDVISNVLKHRERRMFGRILQSVRALKALRLDELEAAGIDVERLRNFSRLAEGASKALDSFLSGLRFDLSTVQTMRLFRRGARG